MPTNIKLLPAETTAAESSDVDPGTHLRTLDPPGFTYRLPENARPREVRHQARLLAHQQRKYFSDEVAIANEGIPDELSVAFAGGLLMGRYQSGAWKSEPVVHPLTEESSIISFSHDSPELMMQFQRERMLAATQVQIMALVDAPANIKRPQYLAEFAEASGKRYGVSVRVLDKEACMEEGMGALLAVNRGSEDPARFIIMEYSCEDAGASIEESSESSDGKPQAKVALIGKGITFDTGGISIKGSANLHLMKSDMGGGRRRTRNARGGR